MKSLDDIRHEVSELQAKYESVLSNKPQSVEKPRSAIEVVPAGNRASKHKKPIAAVERLELIKQISTILLKNEISQGAALKALRLKGLGLKQDAYAKLVKVSRKTISDIENGKGNYSLDVVNRTFMPFGLQVGLIPVSPQLLTEILAENN